MGTQGGQGCDLQLPLRNQILIANRPMRSLPVAHYPDEAVVLEDLRIHRSDVINIQASSRTYLPWIASARYDRALAGSDTETY